MKKMKKILFIIFILIISISKVSAYDLIESFHFGSMVPNAYVTKIKNGNLRNTSTWMLLRSDNNYVYCIDPFTNEINGNYEGYIGYNELFGLSKEQINRMNLLAHYGYGYNNHTDIKWYGITQYLIWETLGLDDIYYTDTLYGNKIIQYKEELNELNSLVNNHYITPNFNIENNYSIKEQYTLVDNNNVLDLYDIDYNGNININKVGNTLTISSDNPGTYTIRFIKKSSETRDYILYNNNVRQNMFYPGKYDDVTKSITITFKDGTIEINKQDRENITSQAPATLEGAVYGLYDEDNKLIQEISLDNNGYGVISDLPLRNYYIKEIQPSKGYMLDDTKYEVNLTSTNNHQKLIVYEDIIKNKYKIIKKYGNEITDNYYLESDASFELYDEYNNLIDTYITDESGTIELLLPFGKYILKQISGKDNFEISSPIEIDASNIKEETIIELKDKEIIKKGNLEIKKIGSDNLLLNGAKFKLFAKKDIVSLTGDIYYKADELIDEITINNGYGYISDLYYGEYYLEEVEGVNGYLLNTDNIDINIDNDFNNIEVINEQYEIPNTLKNEINYNKILSNIFIIIGFIGIYETKKYNFNK